MTAERRPVGETGGYEASGPAQAQAAYGAPMQPPPYSVPQQPAGYNPAVGGPPVGYAPAQQQYYAQPVPAQQQYYAQQPIVAQPVPGQQQYVVAQPQAVAYVPGVAFNAPMTNAWAHDLCGCCDHGPEPCLLGWCCPLIASCCAADIVTNRTNTAGILIRGAIAWCCGCPWIQFCLDRGDVRRVRGIQGDGCEDCILVCCCTPCAVTQAYNEALTYEKGLVRGQFLA